MLHHGFELQLPPDAATPAAAVASAVLGGRCLTYVRRGAPSPPAPGDALRVWPLSLALFPTHPVYASQRAHEASLERPFIVHYNWLETSRDKQAAMAAGGHWFLPPDAPLYEGGDSGG